MVRFIYSSRSPIQANDRSQAGASVRDAGPCPKTGTEGSRNATTEPIGEAQSAPSQANAQALISRETKYKPKNHTAECAIYCNHSWFRKFLAAKHGLYVPKHMDEKLKADMTAVKVRGILQISSRRQLNTNKDAALRWKYLRLDAWAWRKAK